MITVKNQRSNEKVHTIRNLGEIDNYVYELETENYDLLAVFHWYFMILLTAF